MDVCFGGTIDPLLARSRSVEKIYAETTETEYLVRKLSKRTRKFLTSGSKEYVSDGIRGKHSPFAAKFVQALREVGGGTDRILTATVVRNNADIYVHPGITSDVSFTWTDTDPVSEPYFYYLRLKQDDGARCDDLRVRCLIPGADNLPAIHSVEERPDSSRLYIV